MQLTLALALLLLRQGAPEQEALNRIRDAVGSGSPAKVQALFARKNDADYLLEMAQRQGGFLKVGVNVIPAPPGWNRWGDYWAIFHTFQDIESDHDVVFPLAWTPDGYVIGREIPETTGHYHRIKNACMDVFLDPPAHAAHITAHLDLFSGRNAGSAIFRLNDIYVPSSGIADGKTLNVVVADDRSIPKPKRGDLLRAGGLMVVWDSGPVSHFSTTYRGVVNTPLSDKITSKVCYLTAWWVPTIARQPHTTAVRVQAPKDWIVTSEGVPSTEDKVGFAGSVSNPENVQVRVFQCDIPISYPKVIAGKYILAAELKEGGNNGKSFRSYQLEPVDHGRGMSDVQIMRDAAAFYEKNLGPFPFQSYDCFDADTYYGIESYSYTLLNHQFTTRFVSHEMGHTYFGGLAPCSYTRDSWNEGVTQYVDSVLFQQNRDGTLQNALRTLDLAVPLTKMPIPHLYGSATYYRGAYVMKMLENEYGLEKVLAGLRGLIADRRGVDTSWPELRPYFEKSIGENLEWFWNQWIENATFPTIEIVEARKFQREKRWSTFITVRQSGTPDPFRMRFKVSVSKGRSYSMEKVVALTQARDTYRIDTDFVPEKASLDVFPYSLARKGADQPVR